MDAKSFAAGFLLGVRDSFRGIYTVFHVDKDAKKKKLSQRARSHSQSPMRQKQDLKNGKSGQKQDKEEPVVWNRTFACVFINLTVLLVFFVVAEYASIPFQKYPVLYYPLYSFGLLCQTIRVPLIFLFLKLINCLLFQDIGHTTYKVYSRGRENTGLGFSRAVADFAFSLIVEIAFAIQAHIVSYVPIVGEVLRCIHLSLLYSLYSFEYKWSEMGVGIHQRLILIETNWPYFLGFGLPLAFLTQWSHYIVSASVFSIVFPIYIIGATETQVPAYPSVRLQLFSGVVYITNQLVYVTNKLINVFIKRPSPKPAPRVRR